MSAGDRNERTTAAASEKPGIRSLRTRYAAQTWGEEPPWLDQLRRDAWSQFEAAGIPSRRQEAWKGTSFARLEAMEFSETEGEAALDGIDAATPELVFIDGRIDRQRSRWPELPAGARLLSLAEVRRDEPELLEGKLGALADPKRHALVALQTAFLDDGAVLILDRGVTLPTPIRLRCLASGATRRVGNDTASTTGNETASVGFPRLLVVAGADSQATIALSHAPTTPLAPKETPESASSRNGGFTAFVGELDLAANARVDFVQLQAEGSSQVHFTSLHARLDRTARLETNVVTLGEGLVRSELEVVLAEPGAEATLRGFFLGCDDGHVDHFTTVDHAADHCTSDEEYRGVLADRSHGVFRGRVIVRPDSQKTDARQSNPNLLLSPRAHVDTKPQLEIYADDVRASHGSTIGQLDEDALFFLRARGIDEAEARILLTRGFASGIVDAIADDITRLEIANQIESALADLAGARGSNSKEVPR